MPNRNQNHQGDNRSRRQGSEFDNDYGPHTENDEGDSSVRAGSYDQGRAPYGQGSRERYPGYGDFGRGDYSGQRDQRGNDNQSGGSYGYGYEGQSGRESQRGRAQGQNPRSGRDSGSSGTSMYGRSFTEADRGSHAGQASDHNQGSHRGKGPKGYQRSDERLKELICERLQDDPQIDPSDVTIQVQGGKVTLEGTVDSRQSKNSIEDIAEQFGAQEVQNNLRVQRAASGEDAGGRVR